MLAVCKMLIIIIIQLQVIICILGNEDAYLNNMHMVSMSKTPANERGIVEFKEVGHRLRVI